MGVLETVLQNTNTWLVLLLVGVLTWAVRQVTTPQVEAARWFRLAKRLGPLPLGAALALIPGLQPVAGNLVQSAAVGLIAGSFATSAYEGLREAVGERIAALLGSRAARAGAAPPPDVGDPGSGP